MTTKPNSGTEVLDGSEHICEVWAFNLEEEMERLRDIAEKYPYIAMDTEFPGVVARPVGPFRDGQDYNYQRVKCNVDLLKVIQIGLTFCDAQGRLPTEDGEPFNTWQFNFQFDLSSDLFASDSITFLQASGVDFDQLQQQGVDVSLFGELLMSSGIVLNDDIRWLSFQGKYDFAYLVKVLTCDQLPSKQEQFFDLLQTYFPNLYDIRWLTHNLTCADEGSAEDALLKSVKDRGLEELAQSLGVGRIGQAHQAGSDSLITAKAFFALKKAYCPDLETNRHEVLANILHGLGRGFLRTERDAVRPDIKFPVNGVVRIGKGVVVAE